MNKYTNLGKKIKIKKIKRSSRRITQIAVHCAFTPPDMDIGAREIHSWHQARGWSGIGYHYVIRRDGTVEIGRDVDAIGANVRGHNSHTIGISYAGGAKREGGKLVSDMDNPTKKQRKAIIRLAHHIASIHGLSYRDILGHNEFPGVHKACPNLSMTAIREKREVEPMNPPYIHHDKPKQKFRFSSRSLRRLEATGKPDYIAQMKRAIKRSDVDITILPDGSFAPYPEQTIEGYHAIARAIIAAS